jgi:acyl transferase domain-containing protein
VGAAVAIGASLPPDETIATIGLTSGAPAHVLAALGAAHLAGVAIDWRAVAAGRGSRVALPTYPFERQRYWITDDAPVQSRAPADARIAGPPAPESGMLRAQVAEALPAEREDVVLAVVREEVARVLRLEPGAAPDRRHRLVDLGIDSLMALELRGRLERAMGTRDVLSATLVFDYPSIEAIAAHLLSIVVPKAVDAVPAAAPSLTGDRGAAARVAELTDEEVEALLLQKLGNV